MLSKVCIFRLSSFAPLLYELMAQVGERGCFIFAFHWIKNNVHPFKVFGSYIPQNLGRVVEYRVDAGTIAQVPKVILCYALWIFVSRTPDKRNFLLSFPLHKIESTQKT